YRFVCQPSGQTSRGQQQASRGAALERCQSAVDRVAGLVNTLARTAGGRPEIEPLVTTAVFCPNAMATFQSIGCSSGRSVVRPNATQRERRARKDGGLGVLFRPSLLAGCTDWFSSVFHDPRRSRRVSSRTTKD